MKSTSLPRLARRAFITLLGSAAAWPIAARAQPVVRPLIGYIGFGALDNSVLYLAAFRKGLGETGFVEGQNVAIEYRWLEGRYDRMPEVTADLAHRAVTRAVCRSPMASSIPAASSSRRWQRDMRFRRPLRCANTPTPAG
jgi:putative tryptophan/tyrosine transport system substrate-binding protein